MSIAAHLLLAYRLAKDRTSMTQEDEDHIFTLMDSLNLTKIKNEYVSQISEVERRKVSIAMAMLINPEFIILDEPTKDLDF